MKEEALLPDVTECISKFKLTFKDVPDQDIEALFTDNVIKFYKKGEYIYNEGTPYQGMLFPFLGYRENLPNRSCRERPNHPFRERGRHFRVPLRYPKRIGLYLGGNPFRLCPVLYSQHVVDAHDHS